MKKGFITLLVLMLIFGIIGCSAQPDKTESSKTDEYAPSVDSQEDEDLSEAMIKRLTERALYNKVDSQYDAADAASTRYAINKIEKDGSTIYVYGSVSLYDKYGQRTTGWIDNSGSYNRVFKVKINNGRVVSTEID